MRVVKVNLNRINDPAAVPRRGELIHETETGIIFVLWDDFRRHGPVREKWGKTGFFYIEEE